MRCLRLGGPVHLRKDNLGSSVMQGQLSQREDSTGVVWRATSPPASPPGQGGEGRQSELKVLIQSAMQAGDYESLAAHSVEMKNLRNEQEGGGGYGAMHPAMAHQAPLVFPYARVIDFTLGHSAYGASGGVGGVGGAGGESPDAPAAGVLSFSLLLDMDPGSSTPGGVGTLLPWPQGTMQGAGGGARWLYSFQVENPDPQHRRGHSTPMNAHFTPF